MKLTKLFKLGAVLGCGMLIAPKEGSELRKDLRTSIDRNKPKLKKTAKKIDQMMDRVKGLEPGEARTTLKSKLADLRKSIKSIDSKKVTAATSKSVSVINGSIANISKEIKENEPLKKGAVSVLKSVTKVSIKAVDKTAELAQKGINRTSGKKTSMKKNTNVLKDNESKIISVKKKKSVKKIPPKTKNASK